MTEWRPVIGFEGKYEVGDDGRVRSVERFDASGAHRRSRELRPSRDGSGYLQVVLCDGRRHNRKVHRLVLEAWTGPRPRGLQARHLDGNQLNNTRGNLAWGTGSANVNDQVAHGRHHTARRTHCPRNHPYPPSTPGKRRRCRVCPH